MNRNAQEKIIARYGEPFVKTRTALKLNSGCVCELVRSHWSIRYIRPLKTFEWYRPFQGIWKPLDEDAIIRLIRRVALVFAPKDCNPGLVNIVLTYSTLNDVAKFLRIQAGIDNLLLPPCRFIHLRDCLLIFDDVSKTFNQVPFSPKYNSRNRICLPYNPAAKCPRFINELILPMLKNKGDLLLIQLYFGQCLLHENISQTFLIISGPGEVGKSVLVNIIEAILGEENVTELHPERLSSPFELAEYASNSLLTAKDVENDALSANKINALKKLTGNDLLAAEQKNRNTRIYVRGTFNIIITGNGDLTLNLGSSRDAFKRRMIWIDCKKPENFTRIEGYDKVLLDEERDGILAWGIEGALKLLIAGGIIVKGEEQENAIEYLLGESAPVETFIKNCVTYDPDNAILSRDVVPAFYKFANDVGWNNDAVIHMSPRQIEQHFAQNMLRLHPECRYSTNIKVPGSAKMLRGYMHCRITNM